MKLSDAERKSYYQLQNSPFWQLCLRALAEREDYLLQRFSACTHWGEFCENRGQLAELRRLLGLIAQLPEHQDKGEDNNDF